MRQFKPAKTAASAPIALFVGVGIYLSASPVLADTSFDYMGPSPFSGYVYHGKLNYDGSVVVGATFDGSVDSFFLWQNGAYTDIGTPAGSTYTYIGEMTADGQAFFGITDMGTGYYVFKWTNAGGYQLFPLLSGGTNLQFEGMTPDGSTVIGYGNSSDASMEAFKWTPSGGVTALGFLSAINKESIATDVSDDGQVIVGTSTNDAGVRRAVRWVSGTIQEIGGVAANRFAEARYVSSDGQVVLGYGTTTGWDDHAFRWTATDGLVDLGVAAGYNISAPVAMSDDGSVAVVVMQNTTTWATRGFYWTALGGMQAIETYGDSEPAAISRDGSRIVGTYYVSADNVFLPYLWTQGDGATDLVQYLTSAGIDLTGWNFGVANEGLVDISGDGNVIIGDAIYSGNDRAYIINLAASGGPGITTPEDLILSQQPLAEPGQQSQMLGDAGIGQNLYVARNAFSFFTPQQLASVSVGNAAALNDLAPAAGGAPLRHWSSYAIGSFGLGQYNDISNHSYNGSTGLLVQLGPDFIIGGGLFAGQSFSELRLGGDSTVSLTGGSLSFSYEDSASPLRLYATALAGHLELDSQRNYANGGGVDSSYGSSEGQAYAASLRAGWELAGAHELAFLPYVQVDASHSKIGAYVEQGGAFPSTVEAHSGNLLNGSLGLEVSRAFDGLELRGRAAWGHRFSADDEGVTTTVASFTQTVAGDAGDRNWVEVGASANYALSEKLTLMGDLSGRLGRTAAPAGTLMLGLKYSFD